MKKLFRTLLTVILALGVFTALQLQDEHHHVHALEEGDVLSLTCPDCGNRRCTVIDPMTDPECTNTGLAWVRCNNCSYEWEATVPALGHDYQYLASRSTEPTCTEGGTAVYVCSRCGETNMENVNALGHNYTSTVTREATCTEDGLRTYRCTRCSNSYTETIAAIGHDYVSEVQSEPTCTEQGVTVFTCNNCGDTYEELAEALGHEFSEFVVTKEATCEEAGLQEQTCSRCGEVISEVIPAKGHSFPEEWTVVKEPGLMSEGLQTKTCPDCGQVQEEKLPAKVKPPVVVIIVIGTVSVITGAIYLIKHSALIGAKEIVPKGVFKPSLETKIVVITSEDEEMIELLKKQFFLQVNACKPEELADSVEENEPNIVICEANDSETIEGILELKKENFEDTALGLIVAEEVLNTEKPHLEELKRDKTISGYVANDKNKYERMVKLIVPVLKPELGSCETLENIGQLADLLGIPAVSTLINVYVSGRDIKETLDTDELGVVDTATIISDIASILGLDTLESVAGLVTDVDSIKTAFDEESGNYEKKEGVDAVKDIGDVISDLLD